MVIGEQVHCCPLETHDNSVVHIKGYRTGPAQALGSSSVLKALVQLGVLASRCMFLCSVFRAFRGKAVLGKKGTMHSKWGFHLSHAVCFPVLFRFWRVLSCVEEMVGTLTKFTFSFCYVAVWWGGLGRKVTSFWAWTNSQFGHMALEDIRVQESQRWLGCLSVFLSYLLFSSWYIGYT